MTLIDTITDNLATVEDLRRQLRQAEEDSAKWQAIARHLQRENDALRETLTRSQHEAAN